MQLKTLPAFLNGKIYLQTQTAQMNVALEENRIDIGRSVPSLHHKYTSYSLQHKNRLNERLERCLQVVLETVKCLRSWQTVLNYWTSTSISILGSDPWNNVVRTGGRTKTMMHWIASDKRDLLYGHVTVPYKLSFYYYYLYIKVRKFDRSLAHMLACSYSS